MANCKVCVSTRRIALVDYFPQGAMYRLRVTVFDIRFNDSVDDCYARSDSLGHFYCQDLEQLTNVLKCFGLEWSDTLGFDDALEVLSTDYERRKRTLDKFYSIAEV